MRIFVFFLFLLTPFLWGDTVILTNGDRLSGTILEFNSRTLKIRTPYGDLEIAREEVKKGEFGTGEISSQSTSVSTTFPIPRKNLLLEMLFEDNFENTGDQALSIKILNSPLFVRGMKEDSRGILSTGKGTCFDLLNQEKLQNLGSFTVSFWFVLDNLDKNQYFLSKWETTTQKGADGKLALCYNRGNFILYIVDPQGQYHTLKVAGGIKKNEWHHLAAGFGNNMMKIYLDGKLLGEKKVDFEKLYPNTSSLIVLSAKANKRSYYNLEGRMDNLRLYAVPPEDETVVLLFAEGKEFIQ